LLLFCEDDIDVVNARVHRIMARYGIKWKDIAGSVFIFFIFMFLNNFFLNLGKGGHLPPWFTVWMPHLLFGSLGLVLFHFRSQNRDLPQLKLRFTKRKAQIARPRNRSAPLPDASAT
jgi:hypothetical protein